MQRFYAQKWPMKIWFIAVPILWVILDLRACEPTTATLTDLPSMLWLVVVALLSLVWGFFVAAIIALTFFVPVYEARALKNGGPFKSGDLVQILVGPHCGKVARVCSETRAEDLRVELGKEAAARREDIFSPTALLREEDAEPERPGCAVEGAVHGEDSHEPDDSHGRGGGDSST